MADKVTGFPWNKVQAARSYLLALKPWLGPIALNTTVVPVDFPPVDDSGWIVAPQTDRSGRIYLDRSFAQCVPLHVLAGALEHEYAKVSRGVHVRLSWVDVEVWDEVAAPAFQLEIMDSMEVERASLTPLVIENRLGKSMQFTLADYDDWEVQGPPSLVDAGALTPQLMGLPSGLSAETYAQLLLEAHERAVLDDVTVDSDATADDSLESAPPSGSNAANGSPAGAGDKGTDTAIAEAGDPDNAGGAVSAESDDEQGDAAAIAGTDNEAAAESAPVVEGSGDDAADDAVRTDGSEPEDEMQPDAERQPDGRTEQGASADEWGDDDGLFADVDDESTADDSTDEPAKPRSTVQEMLDDVGGAQELEERRRTLMRDPDTYAWAKSIPHYADEFAASVAPSDEMNAPPVPASKLAAAIDEWAVEAMRASRVAGLAPMNVEVAFERLRGRGMSWERHLSRVISSCVVSEKVRGASDLTYSRTNPNQPEVGIRLMGMTDYAPTVTVIQDVSGSMVGTMALAMNAVNDLLTSVMTRLGARTTWVTMDDAIVDVGTSVSIDTKVQRRWSAGGRGTQLGGVIDSLMGRGKAVKWKSSRLDPPDLLVVSTDGMFRWPSTRPSRAHRLVVVVYDESQRRYLPAWVDQVKEVVVASL